MSKDLNREIRKAHSLVGEISLSYADDTNGPEPFLS